MSRPRTGIQNARRCRRSPVRRLALALLTCGLTAHAGAGGYHDRVFDQYPFDKWLTESNLSHLKWRVEIPAPQLSSHQRLMLRVTTHVDGREIEKRKGEGAFVALLQVKDGAGRIWQNHAALDLTKIPENVQSSEFDISHFAFVLPGDYTVSVAVCATVTGEHSVMVRKLHVAPLRTEPLPGAWLALPSIEFVSPLAGPPDIWFLPEVEQSLLLPALRASRPVHLQILVNTTPSERASASVTTMRRNMALVIPVLKMLTGLEVPGGSTDAALLDLTNRRVPFEQKAVRALDWPGMRGFFADAQPALIDVRALQGQWKMRGFFRDEVERRLRAAGDEIPVVIVLSGPAFFENQQALETVPLIAPNGHLFYIRCRAVMVRPVRVRPGMRPPVPAQTLYAMPQDDLALSLASLGAHIFDATSPEQFRRILAAILEQIPKF